MSRSTRRADRLNESGGRGRAFKSSEIKRDAHVASDLSTSDRNLETHVDATATSTVLGRSHDHRTWLWPGIEDTPTWVEYRPLIDDDGRNRLGLGLRLGNRCRNRTWARLLLLDLLIDEIEEFLPDRSHHLWGGLGKLGLPHRHSLIHRLLLKTLLPNQVVVVFDRGLTEPSIIFILA